MIEKGQNVIQGNRNYFLDNLRTFMIFLVVFLHAWLVYRNSGFALTMLGVSILTMLKYLILTVSTWVASNLIVFVYRNTIKSKVSF